MWGRKDEPAPSPSAPAPARPEVAPPARPAAPRPAAAAPPPAAPSSSGRGQAVIGKSLKVKGAITGTEDLFVDGEVEGTITLPQNSLTIGPNGNVNAEIHARDIIVEGTVTGNVKAEDRIDIRKTGSLHGDLSTARITIEDGAVFRGSIDILKPVPAPAQPQPSVAKPPAADTSAPVASVAPVASALAKK